MNDKDILLAALERASAAESMLRRLVDETENDGVIGWEERMTQCIADANKLLAGKFIDGSGACNTCNGHGMVGGHSGQTPEQYEEWQEPCPDCGPTNSATTPQSSAPGVGGERVTPEQWMELGRTQALVEFTAARREERVERLGLSARPAESVAQGGMGGIVSEESVQSAYCVADAYIDSKGGDVSTLDDGHWGEMLRLVLENDRKEFAP